MPSDSTLLAVGEREGRVVLSFPSPVRECVIQPEVARQCAEQIARSAYRAHYGHDAATSRSAISAAKRAHLRARAALMLRSLTERGYSYDRMARELVAQLLAEL